MILKKIKTIVLVILILFALSNIVSATDYTDNLDLYLRSNNVKISFFMDVKKTKSNFPELENNIAEQLEKLNTNIGSYYRDLKYGSDDSTENIDIIKNTDYIYATSEKIFAEEEMKNYDTAFDSANFMLAFVGDYPIRPIRRVLIKDDFTESGTNQHKIFTSEKQQIKLTILRNQVILICSINDEPTISEKIKEGTGLNEGNISKYIDTAEDDFDMMFFVMDLESLSPINTDDINLPKTDQFDMNGLLENLPKQLEVDLLSFGLNYDGNDGFNMELKIVSDNPEHKTAIFEFLTQTTMMIKMVLPPLVQSELGEAETGARVANPKPLLDENQVTELFNFIHSFTVAETLNAVSLTIKFPANVLAILKIVTEKYT